MTVRRCAARTDFLPFRTAEKQEKLDVLLLAARLPCLEPAQRCCAAASFLYAQTASDLFLHCRQAAKLLRDDTAHRARFWLPWALHGSSALPCGPVHVWCRAARRFCAWSSAAFRLQQARLVGMRPPSFRRRIVRYLSVQQKSARKQIPDWMQDSRCFAAQTCYDDSRLRARAH